MRVAQAGLAVAVLLAPSAAWANYHVYCANSRIEVDSRNPEQMASARGSGTCRMGPKFDDLSDAENVAPRNFGGAGGACSCR